MFRFFACVCFLSRVVFCYPMCFKNGFFSFYIPLSFILFVGGSSFPSFRSVLGFSFVLFSLVLLDIACEGGGVFSSSWVIFCLRW